MFGIMSIEALKTEPENIRAGDTISWLITVADYLASAGWTLKYQFTNASSAFTISSSASGDDHSISVSAATTDDYTAGTYEVLKYVESGSGESLERVTLDVFTMDVLPFLAGGSTATDRRSHVKKVLDAIESVLEGRASKDQEELELDGQKLKRTPIADLLELRSHYQSLYQQELNAEKIASGKKSGGRYLMEM